MIHEEFSWIESDGLETYSQCWEPEVETRAAVCLIHGLGEHSGRYFYVAKRLTEAGFAVLGSDLRGHGKSAGRRGSISREKILIDQTSRLLNEAQRRYFGKPIFFYGHSLGGLLALFYPLKLQPTLAGVIATGPALRSPLQDQTLKVASAKVLGAILPGVLIASGLKVSDLSRDPEVIHKYTHDPLVHDRASLGFARLMIQMIEWTFEHASAFNLPLLMMNGSEDRVTYPRGTAELAKLITSDCTVKYWDGLYHEIHNEPEKDAVLDFMIQWLMSKM
jgi:acylglycerol lipase